MGLSPLKIIPVNLLENLKCVRLKRGKEETLCVCVILEGRGFGNEEVLGVIGDNSEGVRWALPSGPWERRGEVASE